MLDAKGNVNIDLTFEEDRKSNKILIVFMLFLLFFFVVTALFEKYKPNYGHTTAATVILGVVWSLVFYYLHGHEHEVIQ